MDIESSEGLLPKKKVHPQDYTRQTCALDSLSNSLEEKGHLETAEFKADYLSPAALVARKESMPTLYFVDIAGEALNDITKAGRSGRVLSGGFDGRPLRVIAENQLVPDGICISTSCPPAPILDEHGISWCWQRPHPVEQP